MEGYLGWVGCYHIASKCLCAVGDGAQSEQSVQTWTSAGHKRTKQDYIARTLQRIKRAKRTHHQRVEKQFKPLTCGGCGWLTFYYRLPTVWHIFLHHPSSTIPSLLGPPSECSGRTTQACWGLQRRFQPVWRRQLFPYVLKQPAWISGTYTHFHWCLVRPIMTKLELDFWLSNWERSVF